MSKERPHVVVVGASFGGLGFLSRLKKCNIFKITVIDCKEYFEHTPSILKCVVDPCNFSNVTFQYKDVCTNEKNGVEFLHGRVLNISSNQVEVDQIISTEDQLHTERVSISFDYLLYAAGSSYSSPIKSDVKSSATYTERLEEIKKFTMRLEKADKVIILGGGIVGIELIGEIIDKYPEKEIILVDSHETILTGFPERAIQYCTRFLKNHKVKLMLEMRIKKINVTEHSCAMFDINKGEGETLISMSGDLLIQCMGGKPNTISMLQDTSENVKEKQNILVNEYLQHFKYPNIFVVGDAMSLESDSTLTTKFRKCAFHSKIQGRIAANNILSLYKQCAMEEVKAAPVVCCISLGKYDGSLIINSMVFNGYFAAFSKYIIEQLGMHDARDDILAYFSLAGYSITSFVSSYAPTWLGGM